MSNFSTVIPDTQIIDIAKSKKALRVLVLGCNGCMNESLALINQKPILNYRKSIQQEAMLDECNRVCTVLKKIGILADFRIIGRSDNALCIRDTNLEKYRLPNEYKPDLVMVMSCQAGAWSVKQDLPEIDVVRITKYEGVFSFTYKDDEESKEIKDVDIVYVK